jgi:prepilin-type N-terminal cleavage/methylation domain-containing protein
VPPVNKLISFRNENGLTLIELVVTLAMIGFVILALYTFYFSGLKSWHRGIDQMEHQQNARIAMDKMIRELRYASEVAVFDYNREIRFKTPGESRTLRFRLAGQELVFDSYPTGHFNYYHTKVALCIDDLYFSVDQDDLVTISISAGNGSGTVTLNSAVRPRNIRRGD